MKLTSMEFPKSGIRLTGIESTMSKKSRLIESITNAYVAYSKMNRANEEIYHLLNKTASGCNTHEMIDMNLRIQELRKGLSDFEQAYAELYESASEEELPNECFDNNLE